MPAKLSPKQIAHFQEWFQYQNTCCQEGPLTGKDFHDLDGEEDSGDDSQDVGLGDFHPSEEEDDSDDYKEPNKKKRKYGST